MPVLLSEISGKRKKRQGEGFSRKQGRFSFKTGIRKPRPGQVSFRSGIAMVEILPLLVVFIAFFGLCIGLWGAVHSGILQSISARHYAFEVINNRTHPDHHRDWDPALSGDGKMFGSPSDSNKKYHGDLGMRLFAVVTKQATNDPEEFVENRGLNFFSDIDRSYDEEPGGILSSKKTEGANNYGPARVGFLEEEKSFVQAPPINPVWLLTGYGICLNLCCGDEQKEWPCPKQ